MIRIALPADGDLLFGHFGGASTMAFFDADPQSRTITGRHDLPTPPHKPGVLPTWVRQQGATVVIVGGIGERAMRVFDHAGIRVVNGAAVRPLAEIVQAWLEDRLSTSPEACHHDHHHHGHDHDHDHDHDAHA